MLIEALVGLSLFGLILTAVAEAHHVIAKLSHGASIREEREEALLAEHYKDPSIDSNCTSNILIPNVIKEICCTLDLAIDTGQKQSRNCKLSQDAGTGLVSFIMASFFLTLLATLSYPTLRQLMIERKQSRESLTEKLSVAETKAELQRNLFDNQALRLPGVSRVLSLTDPLVRPARELPNQGYAPHPSSSILLTSEIDFRYFVHPAKAPLVDSNKITFTFCGKFPADSYIAAGFSKDDWDFYSVLSKKQIFLPSCSVASSLTIKRLDGFVSLVSNLTGLAPIKQSDLYYLDNSNSLRRYSLIQSRSTPVDYGYTRFLASPIAQGFHFELTKKGQNIERDFLFDINLESTDASSFFSLLY